MAWVALLLVMAGSARADAADTWWTSVDRADGGGDLFIDWYAVEAAVGDSAGAKVKCEALLPQVGITDHLTMSLCVYEVQRCADLVNKEHYQHAMRLTWFPWDRQECAYLG